MIAFAWAEFALGMFSAFILLGVTGIGTAIWLLAGDEEHYEVPPSVVPDKIDRLEERR